MAAGGAAVLVVLCGGTWRTHRRQREYIVTYSLPGTKEPEEFLTTPERWKALAQRKKAIAEVHAGRFGWPWVKTLRPIAVGKVIRL